MDIYDEVYSLKLSELKGKYPICGDFLKSHGFLNPDEGLPLPDAVDNYGGENLSGFDGCRAAELVCSLLESSLRERCGEIETIEILGGRDKAGEAENCSVIINKGELISIVGPTGAGKSQLLEDIECAAAGDTPTGRRVLFNGRVMDDDERFFAGSHMIAQLSQNMNFVLDVSVREFLDIHAHSRGIENPEDMTRQCFETANALSGESFSPDTKLTRLSGGQARALMIADAASISPSPILLIDEIENAGIDRVKAVELLSGGNKIVLLATHDPMLALMASKRIVLSGGGIRAVLNKSSGEEAALEKLIEADRLSSGLRDKIRAGRRV